MAGQDKVTETTPNESILRTWKRFIDVVIFVKVPGWKLFGAAVIAILATAVALPIPRVVRHIADAIVDKQGAEKVITLAGICLGLALLRMFLTIQQESIVTRISRGFTSKLRLLTLNCFLKGNLSHVEAVPTGKAVSIVMGDSSTVANLLCGSFLPGAVDALMVLALLAAMFIANIPLAILTVCSVPFVVGISALFQRRRRELAVQQRVIQHEVSSRMHECMKLIKLIKATATEETQSNQFFGNFERSDQLGRRLSMLKAWSKALTKFTGTVVTVTLFSLGGWLVFTQRASFGNLLEFIMYFNLLQSSMQDVKKIYVDLEDGRLAVHCIHSHVIQGYIPREQTEGEQTDFIGTIRFESVGFTYPEVGPEQRHKRRSVFRELSWEIECGSMVAVTGPNGAGKSTLVWLLLKYYLPDNGRITLGGRDVMTLDSSHLRRSVALSEQDSRMIRGTILGNITYGSANVSETDLRQVIEIAGIDQFVKALPAGYETLVGEGGLSLSTGQKQRIALARAMIRRPKILILDEALNSVDKESERRTLKAIRSMQDRPTVIVVTHNQHALDLFDKIHLLEDGRLVSLDPKRVQT